MSELEQIREIAALADERLAGAVITVRTGELLVRDADRRVVEALAEAARVGVQLNIEGTPRTVGRWWHEVRDAIADGRPRLTLVKP